MNPLPIPLLGFLYTTLAAAIILPVCALVTMLSKYGVVGCCYLLSASMRALGQAIEAHREIAAGYRRQALDAMPRKVIDVSVHPSRRSRRKRLGAGGRLLRRVGKLLGGKV